MDVHGFIDRIRSDELEAVLLVAEISLHTRWIRIPSQKVIGDYLCRLGGPKYLLRRYVGP